MAGEVVDILALLDAGGNVATIVVMLALWKIDRRVLSLELKEKKGGDCRP